jgi:sulfatase modifying factor 1
MIGNVWEWCSDRYGRCDRLDIRDPMGPGEGELRVRRGGSWFDPSQVCRSAYRARGSAGDKFCNLGFRVACTAAGGPARR